MTASKKNLQGFMKDHISPEANVRTDGWAGYKGLEKEFPNIRREKSEKKGKNSTQMHRWMMMFKAWFTGMHHSVKYLQSYINEYTYRFNRHKMKEGIFENLMARMVQKDPYTYKTIIGYTPNSKSLILLPSCFNIYMLQFKKVYNLSCTMIIGLVDS